MLNFVSNLRKVCGFHRFPPPMKLNTKITEILLKVALNTITLSFECENHKKKLDQYIPIITY